eukprot:GFUD01133612.1.p1 GENE.GFUD01133612.1~~GFUD01133612.1.p1  ORF type:complete len:534 (+),score=122.31 GFUD01133612.1:70-1602(+)
MITRLLTPRLLLFLVYFAQPHSPTPLQPTSHSDVYMQNILQQPGHPDPAPGPLHPIVLVPGDGGSQIEARLNKTSTNHFWCSKVSDWYDLWLNIENMLTLFVQCWGDNVRLSYNSTTRTTFNAEGVETRIPGFGNETSSVEWIDKSMRGFSTYFSLIVSKILPFGYIRGENLHGAPYDFRKAANEHAEYFAKVKTLVESTYSKNGNIKVLLVSHSMGSIMMSYFLNHQTQAWKDKYIRSLVSIAGVWGGTARAVKVFAVGDNLDSWFLNEKNLLWERTNPSLAWLMPAKVFWPDDEVLVQTESKNFTRTNLGEFFTILDEDAHMAEMVEDTKGLLAEFPPPNVEVFCSHGSKVDTTERVVYPKGSFPAPVKQMLIKDDVSSLKIWPFSNDPTLIKGDGDGTVNIRSLEGCLRWREKQSQPIHHQVFEKVNHLDMLRTEEPTQNVADIIASLNKELGVNKENNENHVEHEHKHIVLAEEHKEDHATKAVEGEQEIHLENEHLDLLPIIEVL